jgi:hypothetical protein
LDDSELSSLAFEFLGITMDLLNVLVTKHN